MKVNRHGRAKVLTQSEIQLVFTQGLQNERDKTLFGVCLFTATRIRECCTLLTQDIYTAKGQVRPRLIIRKANTKGKLATRSIPVIEDLRKFLADYYPASCRTRGEAESGRFSELDKTANAMHKRFVVPRSP